MRLLDTNVLSGLMLSAPDPRVKRWADGPPRIAFCTAAVVAAERRFSIAMMPAGERQKRTSPKVEGVLKHLLGGRSLPSMPGVRVATPRSAQRGREQAARCRCRTR